MGLRVKLGVKLGNIEYIQVGMGYTAAWPLSDGNT